MGPYLSSPPENPVYTRRVLPLVLKAMETGRYFVVLLILSLVSKSISRPIIQTTPLVPDSISDGVRVGSDGSSYCESWRFSVETNDAGEWTQIPARCKDYVEQYMTATRSRYQSDSDMVAGDAFKFAEKVDFIGHGMDAWVFDIDETLLSNLPYYKDHEFGLEKYDETEFNEWVDKAEATALPASLNFYKEVKKLGFKIFLLTGRDESQRDVTETNLKNEGYTSWDRLILRGKSDLGTTAVVYKSKKRKELTDEGYIIHGSSGDQWSDLLGYATAERSFKLPNPMYYIA